MKFNVGCKPQPTLGLFMSVVVYNRRIKSPITSIPTPTDVVSTSYIIIQLF